MGVGLVQAAEVLGGVDTANCDSLQLSLEQLTAPSTPSAVLSMINNTTGLTLPIPLEDSDQNLLTFPGAVSKIYNFALDSPNPDGGGLRGAMMLIDLIAQTATIQEPFNSSLGSILENYLSDNSYPSESSNDRGFMYGYQMMVTQSPTSFNQTWYNSSDGANTIFYLPIYDCVTSRSIIAPSDQVLFAQFLSGMSALHAALIKACPSIIDSASDTKVWTDVSTLISAVGDAPDTYSKDLNNLTNYLGSMM